MAISPAMDQTAGNENVLDPGRALASVLEPFTCKLFTEAGLQSGMRVLDLCSGAGHVAFLARDFVGDAGKVVGFDTSPALVRYAREQAAYRNLRNVEFIEGDFDNVSFVEPFDAVVGRLVLLYREDPQADLRTVLRFVRPGGLVMMQELDLLAATTVPIAREIDQTREWMRDVLTAAGVDLQMGPKLHPTFLAAGLTNIHMSGESLIGGSETLLPRLVSEVAATLVPLHPVETSIDPVHEAKMLEERLRADLATSGGVMSSALIISAWASVSC